MSDKKKTTIKKLSQGYGYKYTDLSAIHAELEKQGITYWQETRWDERAGADYIYTHIIIDGEELPERRGVKVIETTEAKMNAAQAQGSGITYARRYSLLMALGWATEDDDGNSAGPKGQSAATNAQKPSRPWNKTKSGKPTEKQLNFLRQLLVQGGTDTEAVELFMKNAATKSAAEVSKTIESAKERLAQKEKAKDEVVPTDDEVMNANVEEVLDGLEA